MKHHIKLAKNFKDPVFFTDWDTNLIGEKLREEFTEFLERRKKEEGIITGGKEKLFVGEELQYFMNQKRINMVDDPRTGGEKSQFVLRKDQVLAVDDLAWESLRRFEYKRITRSDGTKSEPLGFIMHLDPQEEEKPRDVVVTGEDLEYFEEEKPTEQPEKEKVEEKPEKVICPECEKEFNTMMQLRGHMKVHK